MKNSKRIVCVMVLACCLSGQASASPIALLESLITKVFRGGAAREASGVGRLAEGGVAARGVEHASPAHFAPSAGQVTHAVPESKAGMSVEPIAKSFNDANAYKSLRVAADKGDTSAMLKMADMTASGKVLDPGEPYYGYWVFQAMRLGNQAAARVARDQCDSRQDKRAADFRFDEECRKTDGRGLQVGSRSNSQR